MSLFPLKDKITRVRDEEGIKRTKKADKFYKSRIKRIAEQLKGKKLSKTETKAIYKRKRLKKDKPASETYIFGVSLDRWRG